MQFGVNAGFGVLGRLQSCSEIHPCVVQAVQAEPAAHRTAGLSLQELRGWDAQMSFSVGFWVVGQ